MTDNDFYPMSADKGQPDEKTEDMSHPASRHSMASMDQAQETFEFETTKHPKKKKVARVYNRSKYRVGPNNQIKGSPLIDTSDR